MEYDADIVDVLAHGGDPDIAIKRATLRYAVQRAIFSPYGGGLLDVRRAVLLDGTDHGKGAHVMTADEYDAIKDTIFTTGKLAREDYDVLDGRELFA